MSHEMHLPKQNLQNPNLPKQGTVVLPLFRKVLAESWRSTLGWAIGLSAVIALYMPLFPAIGGNQQMRDLLHSLPPALVEALNYGQISTGPGYTQATFFGLMGFLLLSIASISWGAAAIGGDEESGLLELTLAHGVTRLQVVLERGLALLVRILALSLWVLLLLLLLNHPSQLALTTVNTMAGVLMFAGLAFLSGSAGLMAGALSGRRIYGIGFGAGVAVWGYVFNALGNQSLELAWLHALSPYYWAYGRSPLLNGVDWLAATGIFGISIFFIAVSAFALRRRDIGV